MRPGMLSFIAIGAICLIAILILIFPHGEKESILILHAGSLSIPFSHLADKFEEEYGIVARREAAGSVATIKKVTELGKRADVVASADYSLIENMMEGSNTADYCIQFAANSMTIAYTNKSLYHDEINSSNWYEILEKKNVRFGFSDPNKDPCGYRAIMSVKLADIYYNRSIFHELIERNTPIKGEENNGSYIIYVPDSIDLSSNKKVMMRDMEVNLIASLEAGEIDYLFIYRSVAIQHAPSGVKFINLPPQIDLSQNKFADLYKKVSVRFHDGRSMEAKPIVYGITIPKNAPHPDAAIKFLKMLLGEEGKKILEESGQIPISPKCDNKDLLPPALKPYVE